MSQYRPLQINQKGIFNPWLVLILIGTLLGWLLFSGKFNSWLNLSYRVPIAQPTISASPISIPNPTPGAAKKESNLNGLWEGYGYRFNATQSGNSLVLTMVDTNKEIVRGTISGNTFNGTQWLEAKGCPNLEKTVPASGTISNDMISLKYRSTTYDTSNCVSNGSDTEKDFTAVYTKIKE